MKMTTWALVPDQTNDKGNNKNGYYLWGICAMCQIWLRSASQQPCTIRSLLHSKDVLEPTPTPTPRCLAPRPEASKVWLPLAQGSRARQSREQVSWKGLKWQEGLTGRRKGGSLWSSLRPSPTCSPDLPGLCSSSENHRTLLHSFNIYGVCTLPSTGTEGILGGPELLNPHNG